MTKTEKTKNVSLTVIQEILLKEAIEDRIEVLQNHIWRSRSNWGNENPLQEEAFEEDITSLKQILDSLKVK